MVVRRVKHRHRRHVQGQRPGQVAEIAHSGVQDHHLRRTGGAAHCDSVPLVLGTSAEGRRATAWRKASATALKAASAA